MKPLLDNGNRLGNANEQRGYTPFDYFDIAIDNSVRLFFVETNKHNYRKILFQRAVTESERCPNQFDMQFLFMTK